MPGTGDDQTQDAPGSGGPSGATMSGNDPGMQMKMEMILKMKELIDQGVSAATVESFMKGMTGAAVDSSVKVVSHTRTQIPVPEMKEGMSFEDYKDLVEKWDMVGDVPEEKKGLATGYETATEG